MKTLRPGFLLLLAALASWGCSTLDSRIKEKADVFNCLSAVDQRIIRNGYIAVGFTPDMVYMALDKPEHVIAGPGPEEETWVYHNFYSADGSSLIEGQKVQTNFGGHVGGRPAPGVNPQNNTFSVEPDPAAENIKEDAAIKVHVTFRHGRVATIGIVRPH